VSEFEYEACYNDPDSAIDLVLAVLKLEPDTETMEVLAAGPLEQVLANHGAKIIDRVEHLVKSSPAFAGLLGGVWQNAMSDDVWRRVQRIWDRTGWDGN